MTPSMTPDDALTVFLQAYDAYEQFTQGGGLEADGPGRYQRMIMARTILRESMEAAGQTCSREAQLLYLCIRELEYVQSSTEACASQLCASSLGADLVERGMTLLGVKDLSAEKLADAERVEASQ